MEILARIEYLKTLVQIALKMDHLLVSLLDTENKFAYPYSKLS